MVLDGLQVLDLTTEIAGPYCTKLLADAGADVVKVEPPGGDPLRAWGSGALHQFLNVSKRPGSPPPDVTGSDIVVVNGPPPASPPRPGQVVVSITPFGLTGPWAGRPATEFTLQASAGSTASRGTRDRPPLAAGGRVGEFVAGTYAAVAALAAHRAGGGEHVDLSLLEAMTTTMNNFAWVFASFLGWPAGSGPARSIEIPSIEPTADGFVGFCTITAQQFQDFLVLIERADLLDDRDLAVVHKRFARADEMHSYIHAWTTKRTTEEIIDLATAFRIPVAPIGNGATVVGFDHFEARRAFVPHPAGFVQPRVPYRLHGIEPRPFGPPPAKDRPARAPAAPDAAAGGGLPLAGLRVIDFTAFLAGPAATQMLAALGADVVKIESVQRPDGMRFTATVPPSVDQWWEWCPVFHGANSGKRSVTLDLNRPEGRDLAVRLIESADVVIENFSTRVMDNFGLDWPAVHAVNPCTIMVRMPAFGLTGPWRDRTGFAQNMEQVSGMAWVTGFADGPPVILRGACDPLAGMHAVFALLVALRQREQDGEGRLVEVTTVEAALNAAAEQVVEHSATGELLNRAGNRSRGFAPQGLYACQGAEQWLALCVADDEQWRGLRRALDDPAWSADPALATAAGRQAAHDEIDEELAGWCAGRDVDAAVAVLVAAGVPAAVVINPPDVVRNPQLEHRRFFEEPEHPVTGRHPLPGLPFRFGSRITEPWLRGPPPTLGQHTADVLMGDLGLDQAEVARLHELGVAGDRPLGL